MPTTSQMNTIQTSESVNNIVYSGKQKGMVIRTPTMPGQTVETCRNGKRNAGDHKACWDSHYQNVSPWRGGVTGWTGQIFFWNFGNARRIGCLHHSSMLGSKEITLFFFLSITRCATGESSHAAADHRFEGVCLGPVGCAADHGGHGRVRSSRSCAFVDVGM